MIFPQAACVSYSGGTKVSPHSRNLNSRRDAFLLFLQTTQISTTKNMASPAPKTPKPHYSPHKQTRIVVGYTAGLSRKAIAA